MIIENTLVQITRDVTLTRPSIEISILVEKEQQ